MSRFLAIAVACLAVAAVKPAFAQTPCVTKGSTDAQTIQPAPNSPGILAAIMLAGANLTDEQTAKVDRRPGCTRGRFDLMGDTFTITGEDSDPFPRRIVPQRDEAPLFYVTPITGPTSALGESGAKYALISLNQAGAIVWRIYTNIPDEETLRRDVFYAAGGGIQPLVGMARGSRELQVMPGAIGQGARVEPRALTEPDGVVFAAAANGGARHTASGFTCPSSLAGVRRVQLAIYDPAEGGQDVSCAFGRPPQQRAWYTLYLTRMPGASHQELFDETVNLLKQSAAESESPVTTGRAPSPTSAAFWSRDGRMVDGIVLTSIGDWRVKLRVTYEKGREADVEAWTKAAYATVHDQVKP